MTESTPKLKWDETGQPLSSTFDDIYFSKKNGLEESRYVFLSGNRLAERFSTLAPDQHFCVGEMGFGTGLNFLSCWQLWKEKAPNSSRLTFISTEKYPLSPDELDRSLALWPELTTLRNALVASYRQVFAPNKTSKEPLFYTINFNQVRLILIIGDAEKALKSLLHSNTDSLKPTPWQRVDAWFLDGFAPAKNPDMWSQALFNTMNLLSHSSTTLATFTAAGKVRRGLIEAGFSVEKIKGFANKREMISGCFEHNINVTNDDNKKVTPWIVNRHHTAIQHQQSIAVIGAGMAGCHTAYSLAKRGLNVTLIDSHNTVANEASGNPQGIIYAKLSAHAQRLSDFNLLSLIHAQQHYAHFWQAHPDVGGPCGVLQLSQTKQLEEQHRLIGEQYKESAFLDFLTADQASEKAGVTLKHPGLFFPYCGWLTPQILCQWLINDKNITSVFNTQVLDIKKQNQHWHLSATQTSPSGSTNQWQQSFDYLVIANANAAKTIGLTQWLPTKPIRGQITYIPPTHGLTQLKTVVCAEGYIAPSSVVNNKQLHAIGASYNLDTFSTELSDRDHSNNIEQVVQNLSLDKVTIENITPQGGRVGFRCTSPDYLPLVGPVPDVEAFKTDYRQLSKNARSYIPTEGNYHQGLYLNVAHGSRGLAYSPLAGEILACILTGEPLPLAQSMVDALNPARFIIRDLCRSPSKK